MNVIRKFWILLEHKYMVTQHASELFDGRKIEEEQGIQARVPG